VVCACVFGEQSSSPCDEGQIFNGVYDLFSEVIDANVLESGVSKLRKRLRHHLGFGPIDPERARPLRRWL